MAAETQAQSQTLKHEVISTFEDRAVFTCSSCTAVLVRDWHCTWSATRLTRAAHQALQDEVISKSFSGREGRGYLLHSAVNVSLGKREDRPLLTGVHTVCDVYCNGCEERVGWYYVRASDEGQKYKEGKYLLEKEHLTKENGW